MAILFNFGKLIGQFASRIIRFERLYFIPLFGDGGSEKVIAGLANRRNEKTWIVATNYPANHGRHLFSEGIRLCNLANAISYKPGFNFFLGFFCGLINASSSLKGIVGSHSYFFYRLVPFIRNRRTVDIVQNPAADNTVRHEALFTSVAARIGTIVFCDEVTRSVYQRNIPLSNSILIPNFADEAFFVSPKPRSKAQSVLFVGRNDPVKQFPLFVSAAKRLQKTFTFGTMGDVPPAKCYRTHGWVKEISKKISVYDDYDILLVTSKQEGFPLVIAEAMARGMIVVSTPVGGIPCHISSGNNGVLLSEKPITEDDVINTLLALQESNQVSILSKNAIVYAKETFSPDRFIDAYRQVL